MSRVPIRLRLTAVFAAAMLALLAAAALLVYVGVREELNESIDESVRARADALAARVEGAGTDADLGPSDGELDPEEEFAQVLSQRGQVLARSGGAATPALDGPTLGRARDGAVLFDARVEGIEGTARVAAQPARTARGTVVAAAGESLDDRDETLAGLVTTFAVGGPVAVALVSLAGYLLAATALAPVEAMRRRATEVSLDADDSLPLPRADDELRRLGVTLNDMLARLRGSYERERRFVADASHELRTPVAVLKAEVEAALQDGSYGPAVRDSLRAALRECDHLAQLAEDLLVVARAGDGELPLRREECSARALLEDVRDRFALRARQEGRPIRVDAGDDVTVAADALRMRQALGNLVDNALRHGAGEIVLAARRSGADVDLTVADAGPGIPSEIAADAFERFTRGDAARSGGGSGLGLAIVRTIARAHGGDALVDPARPAVFHVRIPAGQSH